MAAATPLRVFVSIAVPLAVTLAGMVAVYQQGVLSWTGYEPGSAHGGVLPRNLFVAWGLLVGVLINNECYFFARVSERRQKGYNNTSAVRMALAETAPGIVLSGLMLLIISFCLLNVPVAAASQVGFLLCFGVLVDMILVRLVMMPCFLAFSEQL